MISVFEGRSRQCRASSFHRRGPAFLGLAAACFGGCSATGFAGSFATGLSACAQAGIAMLMITEKIICFMDLPCFHETVG